MFPLCATSTTTTASTSTTNTTTTTLPCPTADLEGLRCAIDELPPAVCVTDPIPASISRKLTVIRQRLARAASTERVRQRWHLRLAIEMLTQLEDRVPNLLGRGRLMPECADGLESALEQAAAQARQLLDQRRR